MEQSIDFPITNKNTFTVKGSLNSERNYGNGSVTASLRRLLSSQSYLDVIFIESGVYYVL